MGRIRNVRIDRALRSCSIDYSLLIIVVFVERQEERRFLAVAEWTGERTFKVGALLGRFDHGERVCGVEERVSIKEVSRSVKLRRPALSGDLNPCTSWP